jgi:hypothetical protein
LITKEIHPKLVTKIRLHIINVKFIRENIKF